jgi:AAA domain
LGSAEIGQKFLDFRFGDAALGWKYRARRTQQGAVIYCAFEGQSGIEARVEAFWQKQLAEDHDDIPFYVEPVTLNLVREHRELIKATKATLGDTMPVVVVLDTLNRSLQGSESSDEDMTAYIRAADAIREAFNCAIIIVHHCGIDGTRPRGHTSLTGACDTQLSVKRDRSDNVIVELECAKDGPQGDRIANRLEPITVGTDEDGEAITSCVIMPVEINATTDVTGPRLSRNQQTMFSILHDAGERGLSKDEWNNRAREAGIGSKRKADLYDIRTALKSKGVVRQCGDRWNVC